MKLALGNRVQNAQFSHTNRSARYLIFSYSVMPMLMLVLISHAVIVCICNSLDIYLRTVHLLLPSLDINQINTAYVSLK